MIDAIREAGGDIVAVMSTDPARGRAYADEFGIPIAVTSLTELFASGVDAVYISTTNERHRAETIAAAAAGVQRPLREAACDQPCGRARHGCGLPRAPASCWPPTITSATAQSRPQCER